MIGSSVWDRPNESKLRQKDVASKVIKTLESKIKIPHTLITNSKKDFDQFANKVDKAVLKPISADGIVIDDKHEIFFGSRQISSENLNQIFFHQILLFFLFLKYRFHKYSSQDYLSDSHK